MPAHFIDRRIDPRNPEQVSVRDTNHGPHVTSGATNRNEPLCFSETSIARPIKMRAGMRRALVKNLHQSGIHGAYHELSDNGLVALAHARRLAKNADRRGSKTPRYFLDASKPVYDTNHEGVNDPQRLKLIAQLTHQGKVPAELEGLTNDQLQELLAVQGQMSDAPTNRGFDSTPPANTSTQLPPAPSQNWRANSDRKFSERLRGHVHAIAAARDRGEIPARS